MSLKKGVKKVVEYLALSSARIACGTASAKNFGQPKEPAMLKAMLKKSK